MGKGKQLSGNKRIVSFIFLSIILSFVFGSMLQAVLQGSEIFGVVGPIIYQFIWIIFVTIIPLTISSFLLYKKFILTVLISSLIVALFFSFVVKYDILAVFVAPIVSIVILKIKGDIK